jgi:hypothetical protein
MKRLLNFTLVLLLALSLTACNNQDNSRQGEDYERFVEEQRKQNDNIPAVADLVEDMPAVITSEPEKHSEVTTTTPPATTTTPPPITTTPTAIATPTPTVTTTSPFTTTPPITTTTPQVTTTPILATTTPLDPSVIQFYPATNPNQRSVSGFTFAVQGDWVYCNYNVGLYRIRTDGTGGTMLDSGQRPRHINIIGDWIYYDGLGIKRARTDGTKIETLSFGATNHMVVIGDWIYYTYYPSWDSLIDGVYKMRTDGTGNTKLINADGHDSIGFIVDGDWIYYTLSRGGFYGTNGGWITVESSVNKVRTDGTGRTKLNDDEIYIFDVIGDWIYYRSNWDDGLKLYKMRTDGTGITKLNDNQSFFPQIVGDWIYYSNISNSVHPNNFETYGIYKVRIDGTDNTLIVEDKTTFQSINIFGDWIYMNSGNCDSVRIHRIRLDGTGLQRVI